MEDAAVYLVKNEDTKDVATLHKMVQDALQYAASMGIKIKIDWPLASSTTTCNRF